MEKQDIFSLELGMNKTSQLLLINDLINDNSMENLISMNFDIDKLRKIKDILKENSFDNIINLVQYGTTYIPFNVILSITSADIEIDDFLKHKNIELIKETSKEIFENKRIDKSEFNFKELFEIFNDNEYDDAQKDLIIDASALLNYKYIKNNLDIFDGDFDKKKYYTAINLSKKIYDLGFNLSEIANGYDNYKDIKSVIESECKGVHINKFLCGKPYNKKHRLCKFLASQSYDDKDIEYYLANINFKKIEDTNNEFWNKYFTLYENGCPMDIFNDTLFITDLDKIKLAYDNGYTAEECKMLINLFRNQKVSFSDEQLLELFKLAADGKNVKELLHSKLNYKEIKCLMNIADKTKMDIDYLIEKTMQNNVIYAFDIQYFNSILPYNRIDTLKTIIDYDVFLPDTLLADFFENDEKKGIKTDIRKLIFDQKCDVFEDYSKEYLLDKRQMKNIVEFYIKTNDVSKTNILRNKDLCTKTEPLAELLEMDYDVSDILANINKLSSSHLFYILELSKIGFKLTFDDKDIER